MKTQRNTRRTRNNDGYLGKVVFWFGQLELALNHNPAAKYSIERCYDSLEFFAKKAGAYAKEQADEANDMLTRPWGMTPAMRQLAKSQYLQSIGRCEDMHTLESIARRKGQDLDASYIIVQQFKMDQA